MTKVSDENDGVKRQQVARQFRLVASMATAIAEVHNDLALLAESGGSDGMLDIWGRETHYRMEALGDVLNGMDAVTADDEAESSPVFEAAREMFPLPSASAPAGPPREAQWQPIETAPAERQACLIASTESDCVLVAMYRVGLWFTYDDNPEPVADVTHWMPLPEPPATHDAAQKAGEAS